ncbi:MAG: GYD domain-containing protein [Candidatus Thorarchaeota archaeon SMTZ1-83]|nr:MAG: hypothetical protein AM324_02090 [Candidatus Thorarchaeota archaeon SMTZ1-83]
MPRFVVLGNLTQEGIKAIKDLKSALENTQKLAKSMDVKIVDTYFTMGRYDWVTIVEAPSIEAAMKTLFMFGSGGGNRTETLLAIPTEEAAKLAAELP